MQSTSIVPASKLRSRPPRYVVLAIGLIVGFPVLAAAPVIYKDPLRESPVRAVPGELMMIAGSGLSATDKVVYAKLANTTSALGTPTAVPVKNTSTTGVATIVASNDALNAITVQLPAVMLADTSYAFWVRNVSDEWSEGFRINDARPMWISPEIAYKTAGVGTIGRQLKVIGRNLQPAPGKTTKVILTGPSTYTLTAANDGSTATAIEHYVAKVTLPASMTVGTYSIKVMRDGVSSVPLVGATLAVRADPSTPSTFNVGSYGCSPNDGNDDTACVLAAIQAATPTKGRVSFAAGTWDVAAGTVVPPGVDANHGIVVPLGVSLVGAGQNLTTVRRGTAWNQPNFQRPSVFTLQGGNVVSDIRFEDTEPYQSYGATVVLVPFFRLGKLPWLAGQNDPTLIDEVTFMRNTFAKPSIAIGDGGYPIRHLVITGNEFGAYYTALFPAGNQFLPNIKFRIDDSVIVGNTFKPGGYFDPAARQGTIASQIGAGYHVDFSGNVADGKATTYLTDLNHRGWRAAFFTHLMNNHEYVLVSGNTGTCTGDKAGDGEFLSYDSNQNTFALAEASTPTGVTAATMVLPGPLEVTSPADFYSQHWIQIVDGKGLGQARKIVSYTDPTLANVTFTVSPAWDVQPDSTSRVVVARQYWQVYTVDNTVDIRGCQKANATDKESGEITLYGSMADSTVENNRQYESDGLQISGVYSVDDALGASRFVRTNYFIEIRGNTVDHEYDFGDACSQSGIGLAYGSLYGGCDSNSGVCHTPVPLTIVEGFGINIVGNKVTNADGLRGGGISIIPGWYFPSAPQYRSTLIQGNTIQDILGGPIPSVCQGASMSRIGINLWAGAWTTVLFNNTITNVTNPIVNGGTQTVQLP